MTKGKKLAGSAFSAALFSDKNLTRSKRGVGVALLSAALCSSASMAGVSGSVSAFNPLNAIGIGLSYAGSLAKGTINTVAPLAMAAAPLMQGYFMYKVFAEPKLQQLTPKVNPLRGITPTIMKKMVEYFLNNNVVGQSAAKSQLKKAFMNIAYNPENGPQVFYIVGPSGCGKNVITENVVKPMMCGNAIKPYIMEASYVDMNSQTSVQDQIFGYRVLGNSMSGQMMPSPLISYIRSNPYGLVVFNEFDKRKDKDGKCITELIEENLRTILDQGGLTLPDGTWLDCSHLTFCFTSNELDECVENIDNFGSLDLSKIRDKEENKSRTVVKHDRSVFNRTNMHVVTLKALKDNDYYEIACKEYMALISKLKLEYGVHLFYKGNFEQVCAGIATEAMKLENGGRGVRTVTESLQGKILDEILVPNLPDDGSKIRKNFIVIYNPKNDSKDGTNSNDPSKNFTCWKYDIKTNAITFADPNFPVLKDKVNNDSKNKKSLQSLSLKSNGKSEQEETVAVKSADNENTDGIQKQTQRKKAIAQIMHVHSPSCKDDPDCDLNSKSVKGV